LVLFRPLGASQIETTAATFGWVGALDHWPISPNG